MLITPEESIKKDVDVYHNYKLIDGPIKVEKIKVMHGANYFSAGPIVLFRINLGEYDEVFTNMIPGFFEKIKTAVPSLYDHYCSVGKPGGFFQRIIDGTLLGHVIEHTSIELQTLAGMDVGYGKTRSTLKQGVYNVIFRYMDEEAGLYAGKASINLINSLLLDLPFDIGEIIHNLIEIREKRLLGPSTQAIVDEATKRDIPFLRLDAYNLVQLGTGKFHKMIRATLTSDTNMIAVEIADNKYLTSIMLKDAGIPVLETIKTDNIGDIFEFYNRIKSSIVIKPIDSYLGKNSSVNIKTPEEIVVGFNLAHEFSNMVLAQPYIEGNSYRLLVIDYKFVAATELLSPTIVGNGKDTIQILIDKLNAEPQRQKGDKNHLSKVEIDIMTQRLLKAASYTLETVLPKGEKFVLKKSGNPKLGGTSKDVSDKVHPFNIFLAERAAMVVGLNVAGVDIHAKSIETPINENGGVVLEVNAAPDFRMHINPTEGERRNVPEYLLNMLFPKNTKARVPIFSITGTAGKTIAARFLDYCLRNEGHNTGLTTSEGLFITNIQLMKGDMTSPESVSLVLKDPTIDCAILETSREGIIRSGLGYKFADYGIVLNIYNEHVGQDDIKYIEDLAYAKSVVAEEVYESGYTILNADNEMVFEMHERIYSKLALFSQKFDNPEVVKHINKGGLGVYLDGNKIIITRKKRTIELIRLEDIPLTFNNTAPFLNDEILAVITVLTAYGVLEDNIRKYLKEFKPDIINLPGRMNLIKYKDYTLLIDNAHNSAAFEGLKVFLSHHKNYKVGVIDAAGDRHDDEIAMLGNIAAQTYNELYLYEGIDSRGRGEGEIVNLLKKGALEAGMKDELIHVFPDFKEACINAKNNIKSGSWLVILTARFDLLHETLGV